MVMAKLIIAALCFAALADLSATLPAVAQPGDAVPGNTPPEEHVQADSAAPREFPREPREFHVDSEEQEYMLELLLSILSGDVVVEREVVYDVPQDDELDDEDTADLVPTDDESQALSRKRRSTVVFRPLFVSRQREAARVQRKRTQGRDGARRPNPRQRAAASTQAPSRSGRFGRSVQPSSASSASTSETQMRLRRDFAMPPLFTTRQRDADLLERAQHARRMQKQQESEREERRYEDQDDEQDMEVLDDEGDAYMTRSIRSPGRTKRQATFTPLFVAKQRQAQRIARQNRAALRQRRREERRRVNGHSGIRTS